MTLTINLPIAPEVLAALGVTDADHPDSRQEYGGLGVKLSRPEDHDNLDGADDFDEDDFDEDCFADEGDPWECAECEHFCPKHNRCLLHAHHKGTVRR